jgi:hypothetical protein
MAERRIVTLPFGEGLERAKGIMVVQPTSFEDLRNVFLFDGKAQLRQGLGLQSVLVDDQPVALDVTVMLEPLRSESAAMGVGYATGNREVWLNRMLVDGTSPIAVGLLGTLDGGVTFEPPIIIGADSDNKFFIAHDEPNPTSRIVTQVYDPEDFPQLTNLQANLDGSGQNDVFFRGVVRHLSYIFGWGYGNFDDPVRGDVVRVSNSGDSRIFEDFAFFEAGQQGETIMVCRSAGPTLMVFKETETYEIFGYSPDTFGIRLADSLFGAVGSRLAVSIAGTVFFWSTQGPRLTSGGPSVDIAVPLDIGGPDPATLVAESDPQDAFAAYDPRTRVVQFVWGQRVYALSIRDPNRPRWSYYELGETAQSSGLFFSTQSQAGGGGPPIGAPENLVFDAKAGARANFTGQVSDGDTITLGAKTYTWQTVLTDVDGNVLIGVDSEQSGVNLFNAVTLQLLQAGILYAASTTANPDLTITAQIPNSSVLQALVSGSAGNLIPLSQATTGDVINFTRPNEPVTTLAGGVGPTGSIEVEIAIDNIDQIGAEDIEIHVSSDGGANYTLVGRVPANGLFPVPQLITVTLESQSSGKKIQPITDYKFSMRYILGGQFSPGYTSSQPDDWPVASQGSTTTTADDIVLRERTGDNSGLWEKLNDADARINVDTEIPPGHELLDIEVFLTIQEAGPATSPDSSALATDPTPPARGSFVPGVTGPFFRAIYNASDPDYPLRFRDDYEDGDPLPAPENEKMNSYQMNFIKGANRDGFSNLLQCYAGPDAQPEEAISGFGIIKPQNLAFLVLHWQNTITPDGTAESGGLRVCPRPNAGGLPPGGHSSTVYLRNLSTGSPWTFEFTALPNTSSVNSRVIENTAMIVGDSIRVAIRHKVRCFGGLFFGNRFDSDWAVNAGNVRFVDTVVI